ncbi:hypothetical protein ANO11243_009660 [Dothideomycetidae sp. 11243]|nr:hypothetical protein ANO11243_009660 [fungal sp. No.11243]
MTNFGAGHETLTSTLVSALAMIASHEDCQKRVIDDLQGFVGAISAEVASQLKWTQACIKEAQRLYPVIGMSLPRRVPAEGMRIHGLYLPSGTTVGCSPSSLHRNKELFGVDADTYNPSRWMDEDKKMTMERCNLIYGGGPRTCPGKYLAEMLVSKIVPTLFKHFDIQVVLPDEDETPRYFMATMTRIKARFMLRNG